MTANLAPVDRTEEILALNAKVTLLQGKLHSTRAMIHGHKAKVNWWKEQYEKLEASIRNTRRVSVSPRVSKYDHARIAFAIRAGITYRKIAAEIGCALSVVSDVKTKMDKGLL